DLDVARPRPAPPPRLEARGRTRRRLGGRPSRQGTRLRGGARDARAAGGALALAGGLLRPRRSVDALAARPSGRRPCGGRPPDLAPRHRPRRLLRAARGGAQRDRRRARTARALPLVPSARPPRPPERARTR